MGRDPGRDPAGLTPREIEVATMVAEKGMGSQAIALALGVSLSTVQTHLRAISAKLIGFHAGSTREQILRWWYRI